MKFVNDLETGSKIIKEYFPEFTEYDFVGDDSGWDNYAIKVNREYLFRFPRRQESLEQTSQFYVPIIPYYGIVYGEETYNHKLIESELSDLRLNLAKM